MLKSMIEMMIDVSGSIVQNVYKHDDLIVSVNYDRADAIAVLVQIYCAHDQIGSIESEYRIRFEDTKGSATEFTW